MTYFKIEKDVPIPVTAGRPAKYLQILNQMIRNDSIAVPSNAIGSVRSSARKVGITKDSLKGRGGDVQCNIEFIYTFSSLKDSVKGREGDVQ